MVRPKGTLNKTETKRRILVLRVTPREYAKTIMLARYTHHTVSQIIRNFIDKGLREHQEDFKHIDVTQLTDISKRYFRNNNNNNRRKTWFKPKPPLDKQLYNKPEMINPLTDSPVELKDPDADVYLAMLEKTINDPGSDLLVRETFKLEKRDRMEKK